MLVVDFLSIYKGDPVQNEAHLEKQRRQAGLKYECIYEELKEKCQFHSCVFDCIYQHTGAMYRK
jgi:hypothetical protein